jgi:uncharacterized protein (TIGR00299 family) protein
MSSLYLDLQNGISGDMAVAALLSLAGDTEAEKEKLGMLEEKLSTLPLSGFSIESSRDQRNGIWGNLFTVTVDQHKQKSRDFKAIKNLITESALNEDEKELSLKLFEVIAEAEAKVHGTSTENVNFHEIGGIDSIVDIVSFSVLYLDLAPSCTAASTPPLGSGITESMHGIIPVPAPATLEILTGLPVRGSGREEELVTPTGASIIKCTVSRFGSMPESIIQRIGYGFGHRSSTLPNVLRVLELDEKKIRNGYETGTVYLIEATIDDSTPEEMGFLQETLFKEGALDVWTSPVYMKKNRPGFNICVISAPEAFGRLSDCMLRTSSSFGLRYSIHERLCLKRLIKKVHTAFGDIGVKVGMIGQDMVKASPEYADCRRAARKHNVSLQVVFDAARREASRLL